MALYQDDPGNLYWSDAIGPVIPASADAGRAVPWEQPFHIHGHRLDSLLWSGWSIGCVSLLLALVALVLLAVGGREKAGLFPALSVMVAFFGNLVIPRRSGLRMVPTTTLYLLRPQPWGALLLDLAGKLSLATMFLSMTVEMLSADQIGPWRQGGALLMGCGFVVSMVLAGRFLLSLLRTPVRPA